MKHLLLLSLLLVAACSRVHYVPVAYEHRDSSRVAAHAADTIRTADTVFVVQTVQGDTVRELRTVTRWRERVSVRRDTVARVVRDSVPYPVEVQTVRPATLAARIKAALFWPLLCGTLFAVLMGWRLWKKM